MDASALDRDGHDGHGWSRPRTQAASTGDRGPADGRARNGGGHDRPGQPSVLSLVRDAEDRDRPADFRTQLVDAMHGAARAQHSRIVTDMEERQAAFVSAVHGRASAEVDAMRAAADDASSGVASWAAAELERIQRDREQKLDAARSEFQQRLDAHEARVEREIAEARARVAAYRAEIEAFFSRLDAESDPGVIAELAARVPPPPDLETLDAVEPVGTTIPTATETPAPAAVETEPVAPVAPTIHAATETPAPENVDATTETPASSAPDITAPAPAASPAFGTFASWVHARDAATRFGMTDGAPRSTETAEDDLGWDARPDGTREDGAAASPAAMSDEHAGAAHEAAMAAEHGDGRQAGVSFARPAPVEREPEPPAPTGKAKDLIRERLRYIAERRAALTDAGAGTWPSEPAANSRPV